MLQAQTLLVDLGGNARYHMPIVPLYLDTLICEVFLSLEATSHKLYIYVAS